MNLTHLLSVACGLLTSFLAVLNPYHSNSQRTCTLDENPFSGVSYKSELVNPVIKGKFMPESKDPAMCPMFDGNPSYLSSWYECDPKDKKCMASAYVEQTRNLMAKELCEKFGTEKYEFQSENADALKADLYAINDTVSKQCKAAGTEFQWDDAYHIKEGFTKGLK